MVQDNITFSSVKAAAQTPASSPVGKRTPGVDPTFGGIVNVVDVDWNAAQLTLPAALGGNQSINTTGKLLSLIQDMANMMEFITTFTVSKGGTGKDYITLSTSTAAEGATVTVTPTSGHGTSDLIVTTLPSFAPTGIEWTGSAWQFTMPARNITVEATYMNPNPHNVTKSGSGSDYVTINPTSAVWGTTITVTPDSGYNPSNMRVTAFGAATDPQWTGSAWTFTMPTYDINVVAELIVTYTITPDGTGKDHVNVPEYAEAGDSVFITPDSGYDYTNITITSQQLANDNQPQWNYNGAWHFYMPANNVTLDIVNGATTTYTLSTAGTGRNFIDLSKLSAAANEQITVTPKTSYSYAYFTISTTPTSQVYGTGSYWTFAMPASNTTVNADYNP